jgi:PiT family inorganic phosphate transporter
VIGAIIGIGLMKGGRGINYRLLGGIAAGWAATPLIAGVMCFVALFFLQNVFNQRVYRPVAYEISAPVLARAATRGIDTARLGGLTGRRFASAARFTDALAEVTGMTGDRRDDLIRLAEIDRLEIDAATLVRLGRSSLTEGQRAAVATLVGQSFDHRWMLDDALERASVEWQARPETTVNKLFNRALDERRQTIYMLFRIDEVD